MKMCLLCGARFDPGTGKHQCQPGAPTASEVLADMSERIEAAAAAETIATVCVAMPRCKRCESCDFVESSGKTHWCSRCTTHLEADGDLDYDE